MVLHHIYGPRILVLHHIYFPCILVLHHIYGSSIMVLHHINISCIMVPHHIYGPCILVLHHIYGSCIMVLHHINGSCIMVLHHIFFCSSAILEHPVPGTMDSARWNNNMACPFTWLKSLIFLSPVTSAVYCLCYKSHRHPALATANTEWISDNSCDTCNFPASQAITVQMCNVLHLSSRWTLTVFINRQEAATPKTVLQQAYFILILWCLRTFCTFRSPCTQYVKCLSPSVPWFQHCNSVTGTARFVIPYQS